MRYRIINKIIIFFIIFMLLFCNISFGFGVDDLKNGSVETKSILNIGKMTMSVITGIASAISVIVLAILGVKYMLGSAEEKSTYKKSMIIYIIGAIVIFSAPTIVSIFYNVFSNLLGNT